MLASEASASEEGVCSAARSRAACACRGLGFRAYRGYLTYTKTNPPMTLP